MLTPNPYGNDNCTTLHFPSEVFFDVEQRREVMFVDSLRNNVEAVSSDLNPFVSDGTEEFDLGGKGLHFCGTRTVRDGGTVILLQKEPTGLVVPEGPAAYVGAVLFTSTPDEEKVRIQGLRVVRDTQVRFCCEIQGSVHEFALTIT
ncbi:hypothetical protein ACFLZO_00805 [Patescibacteria group bacterium]